MRWKRASPPWDFCEHARPLPGTGAGRPRRWLATVARETALGHRGQGRSRLRPRLTDCDARGARSVRPGPPRRHADDGIRGPRGLALRAGVERGAAPSGRPDRHVLPSPRASEGRSRPTTTKGVAQCQPGGGVRRESDGVPRPATCFAWEQGSPTQAAPCGLLVSRVKVYGSQTIFPCQEHPAGR